MKNKNALYIVLGIGAGVVAYYLFCKKKVKKGQLRFASTELEDEIAPMGSGGGGFIGGDIPTPMPIPVLTPQFVAPMETRPLVVNVSTTSREPTNILTPISTTSPVSTPISTTSPVSTPISTASPVLTPISVASPVSTPISAASPVRTPISTASPVRTPTSTSTLTQTKSGFEGIGEQCFEVGECLTDL
jgi:hypothetical protein